MFSECPHKWKLNYIDKLRVSEPSIHLLFGTAMHEVIQKYLDVMYQYTAKRADMLNLKRTLQEKMVEQFNIDKSELEFLRMNLIYSHKCQTRKLFSTGYTVGTPEYKNCIMNKGKKVNE